MCGVINFHGLDIFLKYVIEMQVATVKMLEGMLVKGKSMGRLYALMIKESIAAASIKRNRRPPTPSSKGSSKLGTPKSVF